MGLGQHEVIAHAVTVFVRRAGMQPTRSATCPSLCCSRARFPICPTMPTLATIIVSTFLTPRWRSPTPELAAASTGKVRPAQQCGAHYARRHPLDLVLISARPQWPRDLRRLLPLSLTPLVAGCHGQVSTGGARSTLAARLYIEPSPASSSTIQHSHTPHDRVGSRSSAGQASGRRPRARARR